MAKTYKQGDFPGRSWIGAEGNIMKSKPGKAKVANATSKMGISGLKAKKPMVKLPKGKGNTKVSGSASALASKSPKKLKAKSTGAVARQKLKVKLANYKF